MPRDAFWRAAQAYLTTVRRTRSEDTHTDYTWVLRRLHMVAVGMGRTNIRRWTAEDVADIMAMRGHLLPSTVKMEMTVLRRMLLHARVTVMERALQEGVLRIPKATRVNVRWHDEGTMARIRVACRTDAEHMMVVLAGDLGLRRREISQLRVSDVRGDILVVRGKGGKVMTMPLVPTLAAEVSRWLAVRSHIISKHPGQTVPSELLIRARGGRLLPYTPKLITATLNAMGKRLGIPLSPHDLRRSCGRELYRHTRDILAVQRLLRHESVEQTRLYIGTDIDDARTALETWLASRVKMA